MIFNVYSMRDELTGYIQPTFEQSDAVAMRNFSFAINRPDTIIFANPKHFDLYRIGSFNTDTGEIISIAPELVCTGLSVIERNDNVQNKKR